MGGHDRHLLSRSSSRSNPRVARPVLNCGCGVVARPGCRRRGARRSPLSAAQRARARRELPVRRFLVARRRSRRRTTQVDSVQSFGCVGTFAYLWATVGHGEGEIGVTEVARLRRRRRRRGRTPRARTTASITACPTYVSTGAVTPTSARTAREGHHLRSTRARSRNRHPSARPPRRTSSISARPSAAWRWCT